MYLAALGRLDEAMASVSKGLELNPESQVLSSELERLKGEASAAGGGPLPGLGDGSGGGGDGGDASANEAQAARERLIHLTNYCMQVQGENCGQYEVRPPHAVARPLPSTQSICHLLLPP